MQAQEKLEAVYAAYADENADFDKLAEEQARLEAIIAAAGNDLSSQLELAADALRSSPWEATIKNLLGRRKTPCRPVQAAAFPTRHAPPRRANQPP